MRRYTSAARAPPGASWADTSGVASSRRTEWWAGPEDIGPRRDARARDVPRWLGVRSVERAGPRHPPGGGTAGRVV